jgi:FtsP/CotA-like multicopper oxidase with cupredoxin domain
VTPAGDFRPLPELASRNGVLTATLTAEPKAIVIDGVRLDALVFNGEYGGPVLRLKPGDRLRLTLVNHIGLPVNLHFHGSHAAPTGHGDNMHLEVDPGRRFDYRLTIPLDQPPGLYWYHTHIHGLAEQEVNGGLSGAMIIDGVETRVPAVAGARQRLLVC